MGTCEPNKKLGETCDPADWCGTDFSLECRQACTGTGFTCQIRDAYGPPTVLPGERRPGGCVVDGRVDPCGPCSAIAGLDEACGPAAAECVEELQCIEGVCRLKPDP